MEFAMKMPEAMRLLQDCSERRKTSGVLTKLWLHIRYLFICGSLIAKSLLCFFWKQPAESEN